MIIKSMSRKEPSFGQLIAYMMDIEKSDEQYNVYQNLFSRRADQIEDEFQQNAKHIPRRKNGVYLYHEILSIKASEHTSRMEQKKALRDIAYSYAKKRAEHNMVFGTLHDDHEEHLHYHLLISSNAVGESRKTRLSKVQFDRFKKSMEKMVLEQYPELEQKVVINREAGEKLSQKGAERKRRTGQTPERDRVKQKLNKIFEAARDKEAFFESLAREGMEFYARGKTLGVKDTATGRKHRLKTLGLLDSFEQLSKRVELAEQTKTQKSQEQEPGNEATARQKQRQEEIKRMREEKKKGDSHSSSSGKKTK